MRLVVVLDVARERVGVARSENRLALVLMARGDLDGAHTHLDRSLELSSEGDLEFGRSQVLLSLCELTMQEGKVDQAYAMAREAWGSPSARRGVPASPGPMLCWAGT